MPVYYAITNKQDQHDYIQRCVFTNQLEIYETEKDAQLNCPAFCTVKAVVVTKPDPEHETRTK